MKVGYARVSTPEQKLERQLIQLEAEGCKKIYKEKFSGKNRRDRAVLEECLTFLREGDTLILTSLDRLGRNYDDITAIIKELDEKQVVLKVLDMPFLNVTIEDETLSKLFKDMTLNLLSYVAEIERRKILERQAEGIAIAKAKGLYQGRPQAYGPKARDKQKRAIYFNIVKDLKDEMGVLAIAKKYDVSRTLVYRIKKELDEEK